MNASDVQKALKSISNPQIAEHSKRFFKTGKGEYGECDQFHGIRVPEQRKIAGKFKSLSLDEIEKLLHSEFHEERLTALFILVHKFKKANASGQEEIVSFYLSNTRFINNWDLVDSSAPYITGEWFFDKPKDILFKLAASKVLWEKRIAMLSTFYFIKNGEFTDALSIADLFMKDEHDLIHKAVGWMLREIGKKDRAILINFLKQRYKFMPRTMLRYAIEKFPGDGRKRWLEGRAG